MKIAIIGSGAWGTALAIHFASDHTVSLLSRDEQKVKKMREDKENKNYLPTFIFPKTLSIHTPNTIVWEDIELVIIATPTAGLRPTLRNYQQLQNKPILVACKGFEKGTGLLPYQVVSEIFPDNNTVGLLSGPSFAQELASQLPCAVCLASENSQWVETLACELNNQIMRLYANSDPIGVAVGGAVKNVMAIATGITDGLYYGLNARAALITRGLAEINRLAIALGAKETTLMGLAGIGDLILTCTGDLSRNRQVGLKLAEGKPLEVILSELGHVAEGVNTVSEVIHVASDYSVDMPITKVLYKLIQNEISPKDAVELLMLRKPKFE